MGSEPTLPPVLCGKTDGLGVTTGIAEVVDGDFGIVLGAVWALKLSSTEEKMDDTTISAASVLTAGMYSVEE